GERTVVAPGGVVADLLGHQGRRRVADRGAPEVADDDVAGGHRRQRGVRLPGGRVEVGGELDRAVPQAVLALERLLGDGGEVQRRPRPADAGQAADVAGDVVAADVEAVAEAGG